MAGMLPGVECARRRRFHQGGLAVDVPYTGSRRSSFCLYQSGNESHLTTSFMQRSTIYRSYHTIHGTDLGNIAREAKERLDERLRTKRAMEVRRQISMANSRPSASSYRGHEGSAASAAAAMGSLQREVYCSKKSGGGSSLGKMGWMKTMGWKASEQEECVVCLEEFKNGDILVHLQPCAHRFHWACVVPWLQSSPRCPCCRTQISSSSSS